MPVSRIIFQITNFSIKELEQRKSAQQLTVEQYFMKAANFFKGMQRKSQLANRVDAE
jgi:hypothetical protein